MALTVSVAEIYHAAPVLSKIAKTKLSVLGAMKLNQLMAIVDQNIETIEAERLAKLHELSVLDEAGKIVQHEETDTLGRTVQKSSFKSIEAEQEMHTFGEALLSRGVRVPFRIKSKHLASVPGMQGTGYALTVEECKYLGRFLSYDDLPKEMDEDIEEGEE